MIIINEYGQEEQICDNAKYDSEQDAYICYCDECSTEDD